MCLYVYKKLAANFKNLTIVYRVKIKLLSCWKEKNFISRSFLWKIFELRQNGGNKIKNENCTQIFHEARTHKNKRDLYYGEAFCINISPYMSFSFEEWPITNIINVYIYIYIFQACDIQQISSHDEFFFNRIRVKTIHQRKSIARFLKYFPKRYYAKKTCTILHRRLLSSSPSRCKSEWSNLAPANFTD